MQGNNEGTESHRSPRKAAIQEQLQQPFADNWKPFYLLQIAL
jgi:hypothetical protein